MNVYAQCDRTQGEQTARRVSEVERARYADFGIRNEKVLATERKNTTDDG